MDDFRRPYILFWAFCQVRSTKEKMEMMIILIGFGETKMSLFQSVFEYMDQKCHC